MNIQQHGNHLQPTVSIAKFTMNEDDSVVNLPMSSVGHPWWCPTNHPKIIIFRGKSITNFEWPGCNSPWRWLLDSKWFLCGLRYVFQREILWWVVRRNRIGFQMNQATNQPTNKFNDTRFDRSLLPCFRARKGAARPTATVGREGGSTQKKPAESWILHVANGFLIISSRPLLQIKFYQCIIRKHIRSRSWPAYELSLSIYLQPLAITQPYVPNRGWSVSNVAQWFVNGWG